MGTLVIPAPAKYVRKSEIVDNLTSTNIDKPLSAAMGKTLEEHIQQSTASVDDKLSKSVRYIGAAAPVDTGIIAMDDNNTLKRVRFYDTALSMPSGSWVQVGTLASGTWVLDITGMFRVSTNSQTAFFIGRFFDVRWDINTGIIYAEQNYSSSTITVSVNIFVDYA